MKISLRNLHEATAQQVFDQVATHLLVQNKRSSAPADNGEEAQGISGVCLYRHGDLKCAAGCLIADDEYDPRMEKKVWNSLLDNALGFNITPKHSVLITRLQKIHDDADTNNWHLELHRLAQEFGFDTRTMDSVRS
jgi:hypothetical protein